MILDDLITGIDVDVTELFDVFMLVFDGIGVNFSKSRNDETFWIGNDMRRTAGILDLRFRKIETECSLL